MSGTSAAKKFTVGAMLLVVLGVAADTAGLLNFMGVPNLDVFGLTQPQNAPSSAPAHPTAPISAEQRFLADMNPDSTSGGTIDYGTAEILQSDYWHSVSLCQSGPAISHGCGENRKPSWVEFSVPRGYTTLTGTIGLSSYDENGCTASAQVLADGGYLFDESLRPTGSYPVTYPISGIDRIRLQMRTVTGGRQCNVVFGDIHLGRG
jgi:hypothetical protein